MRDWIINECSTNGRPLNGTSSERPALAHISFPTYRITHFTQIHDAIWHFFRQNLTTKDLNSTLNDKHTHTHWERERYGRCWEMKPDLIAINLIWLKTWLMDKHCDRAPKTAITTINCHLRKMKMQRTTTTTATTAPTWIKLICYGDYFGLAKAGKKSDTRCLCIIAVFCKCIQVLQNIFCSAQN